MKKEIELEIPRIPKFIRSKIGGTTFAVQDLTEQELREIGQEWTENLIKLSRNKKKQI